MVGGSTGAGEEEEKIPGSCEARRSQLNEETRNGKWEGGLEVEKGRRRWDGETGLSSVLKEG